jgi:class 3 adenylate cyclase/tetratricopeptide (TPR) repeat protein
MGICNYCGYAKITEGYAYCPNCGAYLSPPAEQKIDTEHVKLWGGESRLTTLFFVNFVNTSKNIDKATVRKNVIYLSEAMKEIEDIIKTYNGTANKILPDNRILAAFGIPRTYKDDLERALECIAAIKDHYQNKVEQGKFGDWRISIGANTGWVFFGYVVQELSYLTIIGDTVNVAARLTQICPPDHIYLSWALYESAASLLEVEHIGERSVKGRKEVVKVYELKGVSKEKKKSITSRFPLLGREREFEKLINFASAAKESGKLKLCAITGQMGIGKTRLKEEFREHLMKNGSFRVFESYCATEIHTPYYPFKLLFREYLNINEFDNRETIIKKIDDFVLGNNMSAQDVMGLKHLFATDLRRIWGDTMQKVQEEIFSAVRNFLKNACQKEPIVLIFEEFNRADSLSKMLISYLIDELADSPLMILMVNFAEEVVGKSDLPMEIINLGPLSTEDISKLVKYILNDVDEKLVEFIYRISGGNPLFTIEAIRSVQRTNIIKKSDSGQWYLEKEKRLLFLDDFYGVVMSGIDSLSSGHRLIIDYASVIGYTFTHQVIASLLNNVVDLSDRLEFLMNEDFIVQYRGGKDPVYIFRHNLLRDAVYTTLPMRKRKEIHKKVGELLENIYADCLSEYYENLGQQFLACEKFEKAAHYFKLSGDRAKALFSIDPAMNYYNTVLRIEEEHPGTVELEYVNDCHLNLADLYELKGDIQRMKSIAELGRDNAHKFKIPKWEVYFAERLACAHFLLNEYTRAEEVCIGAIEQCNEQMSEILAILYTDLGLIYLAKNEPEKSLLNYNLAWVTARSNNLKESEFPCLVNLSRMHRNLGNYELALEYLNYALSDLVKPAELLKLAEVKYLIGDIYYQLWNLKKAEEFFQEAFALTEQIGIEITIRSALSLSLVNSILQKEKESMYYLEFVNRKISLLVRETLLAEINMKKAAILLNLNQSERAEEFINNALKLATKLNNKEVEFSSYILLASLDEHRAADHLKDAQQIADMLKFPPLIAQALYKLSLFYFEHNDIERAHFFGRKALFVFDDIRAKLQPENRECFVKRPEYSKLLEM